MIKLDELIILQDGLRHPEQIPQMIEFVKNGGFYNKQELKNYQLRNPNEYIDLIAISQFPDDKYYIHDGHHRLVSIYLAGRDHIRNDEYDLTKWTFEEYCNPNFKLGFWTPFDPRTEVRLADFGQYKKEVKNIVQDNTVEHEQLVKFIKENAHRYRTLRPAHHIKYLAENI